MTAAITAAGAGGDPPARSSRWPAGSTAGGGGGLVGVREAARQLGVNPSTISRQVAKGIIPNRGTPRQPMVDLAEARQARATNLDLSKQRGSDSALHGPALQDVDLHALPEEPADGGPASDPSTV